MGFNGVFAHFDCDSCDNKEVVELWSHGAGTMYLDDDVYREIQASGWSRQEPYGWLCPECYAVLQQRSVRVEVGDGDHELVQILHGSLDDGVGVCAGNAVVLRDGKIVDYERNRGRHEKFEYEWFSRDGRSRWVVVVDHDLNDQYGGHAQTWDDRSDQFEVDWLNPETGEFESIEGGYGVSDESITEHLKKFEPGVYRVEILLDGSSCDWVVGEDDTVSRHDDL